LSATLIASERQAGIELNMRNTPDNKANFEALLADKAAIEEEFGQSLIWSPLPGKKSSRVALHKLDVDPLEESNWPELLAWMQDAFDRFQQIFRERVRSLPESK
jgi:hypothetical protein